MIDLYFIARLLRDLIAIFSGSPSRLAKRGANKFIRKGFHPEDGDPLNHHN